MKYIEKLIDKQLIEEIEDVDDSHHAIEIMIYII